MLTASELRRFEAKIAYEPNSGCWLWLGCTVRGYGQFGVRGKPRIAHRVIFEHSVRALLPGETIDHLCRTPSCVNPDHMEPCSAGANALRGHGPAAVNARKSHCRRGHPLVGENLRVVGHRRRCRICTRAALVEYRRRRRGRGETS